MAVNIDEHPQNADDPMNLTDAGIETFDNNVHLEKASDPIDITEDGIETFSSDVHS